MKKITVTLAFVLAFCFTANAQLGVPSSYKDTISVGDSAKIIWQIGPPWVPAKLRSQNFSNLRTEIGSAVGCTNGGFTGTGPCVRQHNATLTGTTNADSIHARAGNIDTLSVPHLLRVGDFRGKDICHNCGGLVVTQSVSDADTGGQDAALALVAFTGIGPRQEALVHGLTAGGTPTAPLPTPGGHRMLELAAQGYAANAGVPWQQGGRFSQFADGTWAPDVSGHPNRGMYFVWEANRRLFYDANGHTSGADQDGITDVARMMGAPEIPFNWGFMWRQNNSYFGAQTADNLGAEIDTMRVSYGAGRDARTEYTSFVSFSGNDGSDSGKTNFYLGGTPNASYTFRDGDSSALLTLTPELLTPEVPILQPTILTGITLDVNPDVPYIGATYIDFNDSLISAISFNDQTGHQKVAIERNRDDGGLRIYTNSSDSTVCISAGFSGECIFMANTTTRQVRVKQGVIDTLNAGVIKTTGRVSFGGNTVSAIGVNNTGTATTSGTTQVGYNGGWTPTTAATNRVTQGEFQLILPAGLTTAVGHALLIDAPNIGAGSSATQQAGLKIANQGAGYSILTGTGPAFFGDILTATSITTSNPTTGTAEPWKLGTLVENTCVLDAGSYAEVEVGGIFRKVALCQ